VFCVKDSERQAPKSKLLALCNKLVRHFKASMAIKHKFSGLVRHLFWREKNRHITVKLLGILIDLAKPRREGSDNCHYRKQTLSPTNHSRRSAFASVPKVSAIGPKQTCQKTQSMSLLGVKRTWVGAVQMSAYDPKRTCGRKRFTTFRWISPSSEKFILHCETEDGAMQ
jgi:hypothetical protein